MKKNKQIYGSWPDQERHSMSEIWANGRVGDVGATGWLCTKCGLTVSFGKKEDRKPIVIYGGGKCLFASHYEERNQKTANREIWEFLVIFSPIFLVLMLVGLYVWRTT